MRPSKLFVALVLAGVTAVAVAQPDDSQGGGQAGPVMDGKVGSDMGPGMGSGGGQHPHGPPPQAIAACKDKSSGASCSFVGRENQTRSGTCFAPPGENHPLACRPDRAAKDAGGQGMGG
ncbi:MAG: hypothetical protein ACHP7O_13770 [Burkholderiales bacterium]